eukprot:96484_1
MLSKNTKKGKRKRANINSSLMTLLSRTPEEITNGRERRSSTWTMPLPKGKTITLEHHDHKKEEEEQKYTPEEENFLEKEEIEPKYGRRWTLTLPKGKTITLVKRAKTPKTDDKSEDTKEEEEQNEKEEKQQNEKEEEEQRRRINATKYGTKFVFLPKPIPKWLRKAPSPDQMERSHKQSEQDGIVTTQPSASRGEVELQTVNTDNSRQQEMETKESEYSVQFMVNEMTEEYDDKQNKKKEIGALTADVSALTLEKTIEENNTPISTLKEQLQALETRSTEQIQRHVITIDQLRQDSQQNDEELQQHNTAKKELQQIWNAAEKEIETANASPQHSSVHGEDIQHLESKLRSERVRYKALQTHLQNERDELTESVAKYKSESEMYCVKMKEMEQNMNELNTKQDMKLQMETVIQLQTQTHEYNETLTAERDDWQNKMKLETERNQSLKDEIEKCNKLKQSQIQK